MGVTTWLILLIIFLIAEAVTVALVSIWFAGGALVGLIAAALHAPWWLQIILCCITALILLFFTRPIAVKYFNRSRVKTNVDGLIGKQAIVISEIDNLQETGQAAVGKQEWTARNVVDDEKIPVGAVVVIEEIKGVKLMVRNISKTAKEKVVQNEAEEK